MHMNNQFQNEVFRRDDDDDSGGDKSGGGGDPWGD